jgi:hypothetical protein
MLLYVIALLYLVSIKGSKKSTPSPPPQPFGLAAGGTMEELIALWPIANPPLFEYQLIIVFHIGR